MIRPNGGATLLAEEYVLSTSPETLVGVGFREEVMLLFGLLAAGLCVWCLARPHIGRIVARSLSVIAIGSGVGTLTWGICAAALGDSIRSLTMFPVLIDAPSEAIGLGAGFLAGGVLALVLTFLSASSNDNGIEMDGD
jgi:hypothetical protein